VRERSGREGFKPDDPVAARIQLQASIEEAIERERKEERGDKRGHAIKR
jgi:hypothetical protein